MTIKVVVPEGVEVEVVRDQYMPPSMVIVTDDAGLYVIKRDAKLAGFMAMDRVIEIARGAFRETVKNLGLPL